MADDEEVKAKLTVYGYPGDATPDSNSLAGKGDRDNHLRADPEHQSVALSVSARQSFFGTSGKSTGLPFTYQGKTYYDDDTSPQSFSNIDVYTPDHPPDKITLSSGYDHKIADWAKNLDQYTPSEEEPVPQESEDSEGQKDSPPPEKKDEKQPQQSRPDDKIFAPKNIIDQVRSRTGDAYKGYSDDTLYKAIQEKYPAPLQQLRAAYPEYDQYGDDVLLDAVKVKYFSDVSQDEFVDRFHPPAGVSGLWHRIAEQAPAVVPGWHEGWSELAKFPQRLQETFDKVMQRLGMTQEQLRNVASLVQGPPPEQFEKDPKTGKLVSNPEKDRQLAQKLFEQGQILAKKAEAEQAKLPPPQGVEGATAQKLFSGIGSAPAIAPAFIPGIGTGAALAVGMLYDGVQAEGRAREKGLDNDMWHGAEGISSRAVMEWILHTPRGRLLSGLYWGIFGAGQQATQNFLDGKPSSLTDLVSSAAATAIPGAIFSTGRSSLPPEVEDALDQAKVARERGDYAAAAKLADRAMLLLPDIQRKAATNNLLAWRNEAIEAKPGDTPLEMPGQRGFITFKGKGPETLREVRPEQVLGPETAPEVGPKMPWYKERDPIVSRLQRGAWTPQSLLEATRELPEKATPEELARRAQMREPPSPTGLREVHLEGVEPEARREVSALERRAPAAPVEEAAPAEEVKPEVSALERRAPPAEEKPAEEKPAPPSEEESSSEVTSEVSKSVREEKRAAFKRIQEGYKPAAKKLELPPGYWENKPPEAKARFDALEPYEQQRYIKHLKSFSGEGFVPRETLDDPESGLKEPKLPVDEITDQFYYSGIDLELMWKGVLDLGEALFHTPAGKSLAALGSKQRDIWTDIFAPEHKTVTRETAGAVIGEQIGEMQGRSQTFVQSWYKQQHLEDKLRFAYEADQRHAYWENQRGQFQNDTRLKHWFEMHEAGLPKGNRVADRMFQLHDGFTKALNRWDQAHDFTYNVRDSYIYHALKNREDIPKLETQMRTMKWADPDFMHAREIPDVATLHRLGYELSTYNLEYLDQMRLAASLRAELRAASLEGLRAAHLAFTEGDLDQLKAQMLADLHLQGKVTTASKFDKMIDAHVESLKSQSERWRSPRAKTGEDKHEIYWVHKDASFMLHRATDPVQWHPGAESIVNFASWIKQKGTGLNLALSFYHQVHMLPIGAAQTVTQVFRNWIEGTANVRDLGLALADTATIGGFSHVKSLFHNQKILNWYVSGDPKFLRSLAPHERQALELQKGGGFVPSISHERQIQIERLIGGRNAQMTLDTLRNRPVNFALDLGYGILSARPYQQWLFGRVIPSLKMFAYDRAAQSLLEARPEFRNPANKLQRNIELRKIRDQVDARFGEQNMRQSFSDPHLKAIGQAMLLSYSWQKSMIEVYGGAIHDLDDVASPKMIETLRKEGLKPAAQRYVTNNLIYGLMLTGFSLAAGGAISQFLGTGVHSLTDLLFPNVGKDKDGKDIRVKPPFWLSTDIAGIVKDVGQAGGSWPMGLGTFFFNKTQPAISTLFETLITNKDYYGNDIGSSLNDKVKYMLTKAAPFMLQQAFQPGMTEKDIFLSIMGLNRASKYWSETPGERMINQLYFDYHVPKGQEFYMQAQRQAREAYRRALLDGDSNGARAAEKQMRVSGLSDKSIENVHKNVHSSASEYYFHHSLDYHEQARVLHEMKEEEFRHYWQLAKPEAQREYQHPSIK